MMREGGDPSQYGFSGSAIRSGWRTWNAVVINLLARSHQPYQASPLSRPGNLGTAYVGVWTGNIS